MDAPIREGEFEDFDEVFKELREDGLLQSERGVLKSTREGRKKVENYSIRGIGDPIKILHDGERIGYRQMPLGARELHPGAVYLHAGEEYKSNSFSFDGEKGEARLEKLTSRSGIRTTASRRTIPELLEVLDEKKAFGTEVLYCKLRMTEIVDGYYEIDILNDRVLGEFPLEENIEYSFRTLGLAFRVPEVEMDKDSGSEERWERLGGTFHAVEHSVIESSDMLTGGGSKELGGVAMGTSGVVFVYDGSPGGTGVSRLLYERFEEALDRSHKILKECACQSENGCPNCVQSYQCGNNNKPLSRIGAIESMKKTLEGEKTTVRKEKYKESETIV